MCVETRRRYTTIAAPDPVLVSSVVSGTRRTRRRIGSDTGHRHHRYTYNHRYEHGLCRRVCWFRGRGRHRSPTTIEERRRRPGRRSRRLWNEPSAEEDVIFRKGGVDVLPERVKVGRFHRDPVYAPSHILYHISNLWRFTTVIIGKSPRQPPSILPGKDIDLQSETFEDSVDHFDGTIVFQGIDSVVEGNV